MPMIVFARPGYAGKAFTSPAMAWLRRYRVAPEALLEGAGRLPRIAWLSFDPDAASATAVRLADPNWAARYARSRPRDGVTGRIIG